MSTSTPPPSIKVQKAQLFLPVLTISYSSTVIAFSSKVANCHVWNLFVIVEIDLRIEMSLFALINKQPFCSLWIARLRQVLKPSDEHSGGRYNDFVDFRLGTKKYIILCTKKAYSQKENALGSILGLTHHSTVNRGTEKCLMRSPWSRQIAYELLHSPLDLYVNIRLTSVEGSLRKLYQDTISLKIESCYTEMKSLIIEIF